MNTIKFLLAVFIFLQSVTTIAQTDSIEIDDPDTIKVEVRHFSEEKISELKSDSDFVYEISPTATSLWDRFLTWLGNLFNRLLITVVTTNWISVAVYIISGVVLIYVILRLLKIDALKMFYSGADKGVMKSASIEEDIHAMDFDELIKQAIAMKQYRIAIRLTFLQSLKLLSDKHYIEWIPGKTNHDYLDELRDSRLRNGFGELNFYFEYAWYGNFTVHEEMLGRVRNIFSEWKSRI
jgi:hypothetical protein